MKAYKDLFVVNISLQEDGQTFCLSTSAKYLLISAYCASYNPPNSDRRFFTKSHGKQRCRVPTAKGLRNNLKSAHETGPKPFPVQRLLFIYFAMLEKHDMRNHCAADIHAQVAELSAMGFLNRVSADGNLDTPMYRCIATFEFSEQLAKWSHGKQRCRVPTAKGLRNNLKSAHETGPKPFPVQRLLFIYFAMLEKHDMRNHCAADIHAQVAELSAMGFLNRVSADGNLDTPMYRCIATFEFSEQLA
uniref:Origin recognition complex subunit 5 C-terminal domain-containing protein n=1 Tax=Wuchereria bancrofti TaxID=6293 RepID=A0AAF5RY50_WUCBA